jgi:hypothetical protein
MSVMTYPRSYYDLTTLTRTVEFPPIGFITIFIKEYADTGASTSVRRSYLNLRNAGNMLSVNGSLTVNFKTLIRQGGGPFSGTFTIQSGTAQQCYPEIFKNYPPLQVSGRLDTTAKMTSLKISGKVMF